MKRYLLLASSLLFVSAVHASYVLDTNACAGTELIKDENNNYVAYDPTVHQIDENTTIWYTNTIPFPHIEINNARITSINLYNTSNRDVRVFYLPKYYETTNGTRTTVSPETLYAAFNTANDPRDPEGALLSADTFGNIYIPLQSAAYNGVGHIKWISETCGGNPLMGTILGYYYQNYSGGRGGMDQFSLNNGKPF